MLTFSQYISEGLKLGKGKRFTPDVVFSKKVKTLGELYNVLETYFAGTEISSPDGNVYNITLSKIFNENLTINSHGKVSKVTTAGNIVLESYFNIKYTYQGSRAKQHEIVVGYNKELNTFIFQVSHYTNGRKHISPAKGYFTLQNFNPGMSLYEWLNEKLVTKTATNQHLKLLLGLYNNQ